MKKGKKTSPKLWWGVLIFLLFLLVTLFFLFLVVFFSDDPQWMSSRLGVEPGGEGKYKALKFLGIGMGGLLVALQALMSYRRATAMEDAANAQAEATENQAQANQTAEQGQRQERLKNAIEHLGHKKVSVRLGGAYELFHLARDSEEEEKELRQTVLDILCAHIRQTTGELEYRDKYPSNPSEEIQSLLTLLFIQKHEVFIGLDINLQGSWLNGSNLAQARLEKAVLVGAQLHGAVLIRAQLPGARLWKAQLHEADLMDAQLPGAYLADAQLPGARLWKAQLPGAVLRDAQLHGADLWDAQLHGADLEKAQLPGARLSGTQLHGARLSGTQLHGAVLRDAQLHGADLRKAQLPGADLWDAQLHGADLRKAQLPGADLWGTQLHGAVLRDAQLHGVSCSLRHPYRSFEASMNKQIDEQSDLSRAIFAGGLTREAVASIGTGLPDEDAKNLRANLAAHIGKPASHELPEDSDAITGAYTKKEADQWIAEYKIAVSAVSGDS